MNKGDLIKEQLCRSIAKPGYEVLEKMSSPRFIKTHFPFSLLPNILESGCKVRKYIPWFHISLYPI